MPATALPWMRPTRDAAAVAVEVQMTDPKKIYEDRLRSALEDLKPFEQMSCNPDHPELTRLRKNAGAWLDGLLGVGNRFRRDFEELEFQVPGFRSGSGYDFHDEEAWRRDLQLARSIIEEALADHELGLHSEPVVATAAPPQRMRTPPFVVNINNVLSNVQTVTLEQIFASPEVQHLPPAQQKEAREAAEAMEGEMRGQKRWDEISKWVGRLWSLGEPVFKRVAVPLLLEYLKQHGMG